ISYIAEDDRVRLSEYCSKIISRGFSSFLEVKIYVDQIKRTTILAKASPILHQDRVVGFRWSAINIKPLIGSLMNSEDTFFRQFNLSPRETEVLNLLLEGYKNRMIAEKLFIAESTVKYHMGSIYSKIGVKNRQDLFLFLENSQQNRFGPESFLFNIISKLMQ
nr:helix-turn-helix transcriptional regulator [Spirochaetaceae bacterium]